MRNQVGGAAFEGSFTDELPDLGLPEVAFAGRSNVGKSSALNKLLGGRRAARVSGRPGRTQTINLFRVGKALTFADLPGYGFARVPEAVRERWGDMIERYLRERDALRLVVVLVDVRREAQDMDRMLLEGLQTLELPRLVLATKVDKLKRSERARRLQGLARGLGLAQGELVPFSSVTGEGVEATWDRIEAACAGGGR